MPGPFDVCCFDMFFVSTCVHDVMCPCMDNMATHFVDTPAYRVAKTHRMPYLYRSFPVKGPYN